MISLSDIERFELRKLQKKERHSSLYIRITVLLMSDSGFSVEQIEQSLGIDQTTVNRYFRMYESVGIESYLTLNYVGYSGKLTKSEIAILDAELQNFLYTTSYEVIAFIEEKFGKTYQPSGVTTLLNRIGFSYKKTKQEPSKADTAKQEAFLAEMTTILEDVAQNPETAVAYFVDAVHPQHNTRPDYGWIKKGQEFTIAANSGRKRVNINGALNAHNVTDIVIDEADTINYESMKRLVVKLVNQNPNSTLYLFHDNARYYYAKELKKWLEQTYPSVKQVFLPPYSPNLNLIERLWKFTKKKIINYDYYQTFDEFKKTVLDFFKNIAIYKQELNNLLTLNFHIA
ncbi:MAG: IS630 family transposase [Saprospiraceae bacterium]|nr:IS630 family transposase [Saprospiraceae bacterium]